MSLLAVHHISFEVAAIMNLITMIVFWGTLYEQALSECENELQIVNLYISHIVPASSLLINFVLSDVRLRESHLMVIIVLSLCSAPINYMET